MKQTVLNIEQSKNKNKLKYRIVEHEQINYGNSENLLTDLRFLRFAYNTKEHINWGFADNIENRVKYLHKELIQINISQYNKVGK